MTMRTWTKTAVYMDTFITIKALSASWTDAVAEERIASAFAAFATVEHHCNRFDTGSELRQLCAKAGQPVAVSSLLLAAVNFAREVAAATDGSFDPTVGSALEAGGFNRDYKTGKMTHAGVDSDIAATYRDIHINEIDGTITLGRPMLLDLGAVAKGLAVDLARQVLTECSGFAIDAGGDIFAGGLNERGEPWRIGVRHPLRPTENIVTLSVTDAAVCTSGTYERRSDTDPNAHHLFDPHTGKARPGLLSSMVVAPFAMLADAYSTAAFILGPSRGIKLLEETGLDGVLIPPSLELCSTSNLARYLL
jgi:thiamine biosynthesis lipoprotein